MKRGAHRSSSKAPQSSDQTSTSYKKDAAAAELTEAMGKSSLKSGSHRPTLVGT
jgi:hypothetical protein